MLAEAKLPEGFEKWQPEIRNDYYLKHFAPQKPSLLIFTPIWLIGEAIVLVSLTLLAYFTWPTLQPLLSRLFGG